MALADLFRPVAVADGELRAAQPDFAALADGHDLGAALQVDDLDDGLGRHGADRQAFPGTVGRIEADRRPLRHAVAFHDFIAGARLPALQQVGGQRRAAAHAVPERAEIGAVNRVRAQQAEENRRRPAGEAADPVPGQLLDHRVRPVLRHDHHGRPDVEREDQGEIVAPNVEHRRDVQDGLGAELELPQGAGLAAEIVERTVDMFGALGQAGCAAGEEHQAAVLRLRAVGRQRKAFVRRPLPDVDPALADAQDLRTVRAALQRTDPFGERRRTGDRRRTDIGDQPAEFAVRVARIERRGLEARRVGAHQGDRGLDPVAHDHGDAVARRMAPGQLLRHAGDGAAVFGEGELPILADQRRPVRLQIGCGVQRIDDGGIVRIAFDIVD